MGRVGHSAVEGLDTFVDLGSFGAIVFDMQILE
jgi:hypothetical protein